MEYKFDSFSSSWGIYRFSSVAGSSPWVKVFRPKATPPYCTFCI